VTLYGSLIFKQIDRSPHKYKTVITVCTKNWMHMHVHACMLSATTNALHRGYIDDLQVFR